MLAHTRRRTSASVKKDIFFVFIAILAGFLITALVLLFFSFILTKIDAPDKVIKLLSTVALGVGTYFGGYICSKHKHNKGIFRGALCGFVMFCTVVVFGAVFADTVLSFSATTKLILTLVCGAIGGIVGANSKFKRY